jgi:hypothetical protein
MPKAHIFRPWKLLPKLTPRAAFVRNAFLPPVLFFVALLLIGRIDVHAKRKERRAFERAKPLLESIARSALRQQCETRPARIIQVPADRAGQLAAADIAAVRCLQWNNHPAVAFYRLSRGEWQSELSAIIYAQSQAEEFKSWPSFSPTRHAGEVLPLSASWHRFKWFPTTGACGSPVPMVGGGGCLPTPGFIVDDTLSCVFVPTYWLRWCLYMFAYCLCGCVAVAALIFHMPRSTKDCGAGDSTEDLDEATVTET